MKEKTNDLFDNTMNEQITDKHISDAFNSTFRIIPTSSKESVAAQIMNKSSKDKNDPSPYFEINVINRGGGILNRRIILLTKDYKLLKKITCYMGDTVIGYLNDDNSYSLEILENGKYTIKVEDTFGKIHEETINITDNDNNSNIDLKVEMKNDHYEAIIAKAEYGINLESVKISNETNSPIKYVIKENKVIFPCDNRVTIFSVSDTLGNVKKVVLTNNNIKKDK